MEKIDMNKIEKIITEAQNNNNKINLSKILKFKFDDDFFDDFVEQLIEMNIEIVDDVEIDFCSEENCSNYSSKTRKPLAKEEEILLFKKYKKGDKAAKEIIFNSYIPFAISIAKKYSNIINNTSIDLNDLIQEACMGIIEAINKFDEERNCRFTTYSFYLIKKNILKFLSNNSRTFKLSQNALKKLKQIELFVNEFVNLNGEEPSINEISSVLNISYSELYELLNLQKGVLYLSQNLRIGNDAFITLLEKITNEMVCEENDYDKLINEISNNELIKELKKVLTTREYEVLDYKYGFSCSDKNKKLKQLADKYGVSKQMISIIHDRALRKVKQYLLSKEKVNIYKKK